MMKKGTEMTKMLYTEINVEVNRMTDATHDYHDTYAFAAGYLGTMLSSLIADLPKHKQREAIQNLQNTALKYRTLSATKQPTVLTASI